MSDANRVSQKAKDAGAKDAARVWRAWRTVHEMIRDRGYELADEEVNISLQDFTEKFSGEGGFIDRTKLRFSARPTDEMIVKYARSADPADMQTKGSDVGTVWIEFVPDTNMGVSKVRNFAQFISEHNYHTGIIITHVNLTSMALKVIASAAQEGVKVEVFLEEELLVNITHHELVPKHMLLSKEEKVKLLQRYRLKETQLPRIQLRDPVARYLGLRKDDVVKIIRKSETAGRYASYRLCVR